MTARGNLWTESHKTIKGRSVGQLNLVLYLPPADSARAILAALQSLRAQPRHTLAERSILYAFSRPESWEMAAEASQLPRTLCPWAGECASVCLAESGHMGMYRADVRERLNHSAVLQLYRALLYYRRPKLFWNATDAEFAAAEQRAKRNGWRLAVRPNGTSDIIALGVAVARRYPHVTVYDYTKRPFSLWPGPLPPNYHLTASHSERMTPGAAAMLSHVHPVAVVYRAPHAWAFPRIARELRRRFPGCGPVRDGDAHDARYLDRFGLIALRAKGRARSAAVAPGFVTDLETGGFNA